MKTKIKRIPVAERTNVRVGKSPEIPDRVTSTFRLKVETKQQLEELSSQLGVSMTVIVETIVHYFANTSDSEAARIRLETENNNLQKRMAENNEKLKKLKLSVDL
jgi:predicted DNA-binding protein